MKPKIAIIGAGISGLTIAQKLNNYAEITVFEKSRGAGGRMSTRYADSYCFDHGAQFFTVRDNNFRKFIAPHIKDKNIEEWKGQTLHIKNNDEIILKEWREPRYVASPNMNSLCKTLKEGIKISLETEILPLTMKKGEKWILDDKNKPAAGYYDWVISTAPYPQTARIFEKHTDYFSTHPVKMLSCHALMLGFKRPWENGWSAMEIENSPIVWIGVNSSKPSRNKELACLVIHTNNEWSEKNIDLELAVIEEIISGELARICKIDTKNADYKKIHLWRYAIHKSEKEKNFFFDKDLKIAATGDWCANARIEDVWINAEKLSEEVKKQLL